MPITKAAPTVREQGAGTARTRRTLRAALFAAVALAATLSALAPQRATAENDYFKTALPVGLTLALASPELDKGTLQPRQGGWALGAEVSYARSHGVAWWGGYLDALVAFEDEELRVSFGPEVGLPFAGFDMGLLLRLPMAEGDVDVGLQTRLFLAIPFVMPYVRWGFFAGDTPTLFEGGAMFKYPIEL